MNEETQNRSQAGLLIDPTHDLLRPDHLPLDSVFKPKSVALIGATERVGSVGRMVLSTMVGSPFGGTVYPVNSKRDNVLGIHAYKNLESLPERPDCIVVTTPSDTVPDLIRDAVSLGVPAAIVISAGFKEIGEKGVEYERQIKEAIRGKMRLIGPNCLGVMNPLTGFNATFAHTVARPGNLAFISQSGALCTAVLDWSYKAMVGFSTFISIGSMLDVDWGDLITYFGTDPQTTSIVAYMESIGDPRSFLSAAREVSMKKPIIVIKADRTAEAAKAAASHTGSLTGSDAVLDAAFQRAGVLRVRSIHDIFDMSEVLAKQPCPKGNRLCIVTNAGGPGVLATDALSEGGGKLSKVSPEALAKYNEFLPSAWSHGNPVDILGDAEPERYAKALEVAAQDPETDGILVIMTPQGMTDPTSIAENLRPYANSLGKPFLASWMGGSMVSYGEQILNRVCHSDLHQVRNEWSGVMPTVYPCVPGHEIVGRVTKVGSAVSKFKAGDLAAAGCMVDSDGTCPECKAGLEQFCAKPTFTYNFPDKHLGGVTYGGYSDSIVVDQRFVLRVSTNLDLAGAAPLLCAGITTYSPMRHWGVSVDFWPPGQSVTAMFVAE